MSNLIELTVKNFRGIVQFSMRPDGKSVELKGRNESGKTSVIDALFWGLGGSLDAEVVRTGTDGAQVEVKFGDYLVARRQPAGKRPVLEVRSADGKSKFTSPTALLSGFVGCVERQTFSTLEPGEQVSVLRKLCPELDTTTLDVERRETYERRAEKNREAKSLRAQASGIQERADVPESVPADVDLGKVADRRVQAERQRQSNEQARSELSRRRQLVVTASEQVESLARRLRECEAFLKVAHQTREIQERAALDQERAVSEIDARREPDTVALDAEMEEAKRTNAKLAQLREWSREQARRRTLILDAESHERSAAELTTAMADIDERKRLQIEAAKLPVDGLEVRDEKVLVRGVEVRAMSTAAQIKLDVLVAAASGRRLIGVRNASLLDGDTKAEIVAHASRNGVQLLQEVVESGSELRAEISEE